MLSPAPVTAKHVLRISRLAVAAAGRTLLREIDVTLAPGELVALRGPSGCGKTTLLRAVAGLIDPAAGEVLLQDRRPAEKQMPGFRRRVILVDQRPALLAGSVRSNLARPFLYATATSAFSEGDAIARLRQLGLTDNHYHQQARSLSQGEQQRVCLARALLIEPAVLLLDEPTSALDEAAVAAVEGTIRTAASERGLAALIVTHLAEQATRWCHRVLDLEPHMVPRTGSQK